MTDGKQPCHANLGIRVNAVANTSSYRARDEHGTKVVSAQVRRAAAPHASQPCLLRMVRASQARTNAIQTIARALHSPRARVRGHLGEGGAALRAKLRRTTSGHFRVNLQALALVLCTKPAALAPKRAGIST